METQPQLLEIALTSMDEVYTPDWAASDMVRWFRPTGKILEPCRGDDAIYKYLPGAEWCEIKRGRDFYKWTVKVRWIIGNPPYSKNQFPEWMQHSFEIADNVVYIMPIRKFFSSNRVMELSRNYGGLKHVRIYGPGGNLGWNFGHPCGALHWVRDYCGDTSWSWYAAPSPAPLDGER